MLKIFLKKTFFFQPEIAFAVFYWGFLDGNQSACVHEFGKTNNFSTARNNNTNENTLSTLPRCSAARGLTSPQAVNDLIKEEGKKDTLFLFNGRTKASYEPSTPWFEPFAKTKICKCQNFVEILLKCKVFKTTSKELKSSNTSPAASHWGKFNLALTLYSTSRSNCLKRLKVVMMYTFQYERHW